MFLVVCFLSLVLFYVVILRWGSFGGRSRGYGFGHFSGFLRHFDSVCAEDRLLIFFR